MDDLEKIRREKLKVLPEKYLSDFNNQKDLEYFLETKEGDLFATNGRIIFKRDLGNLIFLKINNINIIVQIALQAQMENFQNLKTLDLGDIISVEGSIIFSKTGEKTINAEKICLLKKAFLPLPDKHSGLQDEEEKLRKRYIDLIQNDKTKEIFKIRLKIIETIRNTLKKWNFIEVETPILQTVASGAMANPFETHHQALNAQLFLRIAPELFLKRLIIAGYPKVFEIAKCFRNEGMDRTHLQEFTMVETYEAYISYEGLQNYAIKLLNSIGEAVGLNIFTNIPKISYKNLLLKYGLDFNLLKTYENLVEKAKELNLEWQNYKSYQSLLDHLYKKCCIKNIYDPILVYDYPKVALAKISENDPNCSSKFQVIWKHQEIINSYLEMNDPDQQLANFQEQIDFASTGDNDIIRLDMDYVEALKQGLPPTGGLGLGIDRLVTLIAEADSIRDVIFFPITKNIS